MLMATMTIAQLERLKLALTEKMQAERARHEQELQRLRAEFVRADTATRISAGGFDGDKIRRARAVIDVDGEYEKAGDERAWAVEVAVKALLDGGSALRTEYVGTKNYAHWRGQSITCGYGYGPRHGSVCFSIGLTRAVRERSAEPLLTEQEIDDAVFYLRNLERIQQAEREARVAAAAA